MQDQHFIEEYPWLSLATVDYHAFLEDCGAVILASSGREACSLALAHLTSVGVKLEKLVSTFSDLTLWIEHEAATENIYLIVKGRSAMTLPAFNSLRASIRASLPNDLASVDLCAYDILARLKVKTTYHVHVVSDGCQCGTFSRCWLPLRVKWLADRDTEVFSLLHPLNVWLQATHQFIDEFVTGNVLRRISLKLLRIFIITWLSILIDDARLGSQRFNSLYDKFILMIVFEEWLGIGWTETSSTNLLDTISAHVFCNHYCTLTRVALHFHVVAHADFRRAVWRMWRLALLS